MYCLREMGLYPSAVIIVGDSGGGRDYTVIIMTLSFVRRIKYIQGLCWALRRFTFFQWNFGTLGSCENKAHI